MAAASRTLGARRAGAWPLLIAVLPVLAGLVGLGVWQLARLDWKEAMIAERAARLEAPPLAAADLARPAAELDFRRIRLAGRWVDGREAVIQAKTFRGQAGAHVVTPLRLDDGRAVLVDRGWVPHDRIDPRTRPEGRPAGRAEVDGIVVQAGRPSRWTPDNDPARDLWYWVDPGPLARARGLDRIVNVVVAADAPAVPGGLPVGGQVVTDIPNRHFEYALTWFALAGVLVVMTALFVRRRGVGNAP
jgi:surfeit locus 1 family protein